MEAATNRLVLYGYPEHIEMTLPDGTVTKIHAESGEDLLQQIEEHYTVAVLVDDNTGAHEDIVDNLDSFVYGYIDVTVLWVLA